MAAVALITGGTGLVGQHVLRHWDLTDLEPVVVDRHTEDLLRPGGPMSLVRRLEPEVIVHLAWTASGTPGYRHDIANDAWVAATLELAETSRASGAWFLATGTPLDTFAEPMDAYSDAKARLRRELQPAIDSGEITWLRPFYVVDPERRRPALVDQALSARDNGERLTLRTPASRHDFIHASDVGRAIVLAVRCGLRGEVPMGSGQLRSVSDLVTALGVPWDAGTDPQETSPQHHAAADTRRLREQGWAPTLTKEMFDGR